jgi:hypothetical protein
VRFGHFVRRVGLRSLAPYFPLNLSVVSSLAVVSFPGLAARAPDGQHGSSSGRTPCFPRRELTLLSGVKAFNAFRGSEFILKAHVCIVTGDMPGRAKLQCFKGNRASRYCPYCMVEAVHNGNSTYCPFNMPHNPPEDSNIGNRPDYDPLALPLRTDVETRDIASKIVNLGSDKLAFQYGINKLAILAELTSLDMIRGFPPDEMHLYWENIIPGLVKHWRGNFTTLPCFTGRQATHTDSDDEMEEALESESASQERTKSPPHKKRKRTSGRADDRSSSTKFIETEDPWNIPPLVWSQIGRNMYDSHSTIPTQFGEAPRDFWEHSHHFKAAEWKNFAFLFLPVYLKEQ